MNKKTMGEKIAELRKRKGLTQDELAETLNVSRQVVSKWERDMCWPKNDLLQKIADLFGVSVEYLLNDDMNSPMHFTANNASLMYNDTNSQAQCVVASIEIDEQSIAKDIDDEEKFKVDKKLNTMRKTAIWAIWVLLNIPLCLIIAQVGSLAFDDVDSNVIEVVDTFPIHGDRILLFIVFSAIFVVLLGIAIYLTALLNLKLKRKYLQNIIHKEKQKEKTHEKKSLKKLFVLSLLVYAA